MKRKFTRRNGFLTLLFLASLTGYWLLPISGKIFVMWDEAPAADAWPRMRLEPEIPQPGEEAIAILADTVPWVHIKLLVNDQQEAQFLRYEPNPLGGEWFWSFTVPETDSYELAFYHDCDRGCVGWTRHQVSNAVNVDRHLSGRVPTKLGVVFANPQRDWHDRSGWVVELTYTQLAQVDYWGIDDLAKRVQAAVRDGHRVLIRVDYDQGQSLPPDESALQRYLDGIRQLTRDDRFQGIYGMVIGSSFNAIASNQLAANEPMTPEWYARVFNGYDTAVSESDNVIAIVRAESPVWRVLVGPVQPGVDDADGEAPFARDLPWLNYYHTLIGDLVQAAEVRAEAGVSGAYPDGFAIQALGMLDVASGDGAATGFHVFHDWLSVINSFPQVEKLPVYITAGNTYQVEAGLTPAQNYPPGWLREALALINAESQIRAFCWFVDDLPVDQQWQRFSLSDPQGAMVEAANEFDQLLREGK